MRLNVDKKIVDRALAYANAKDTEQMRAELIRDRITDAATMPPEIVRASVIGSLQSFVRELTRDGDE